MYTISESEVLPLGVASLSVENMHLTKPMCAHTHDFAGLGFVRSGRATQHSERGTSDLRPGHLVVMGPGTWHAYDPQESITVANLYIGGGLLGAELSWLSRLPSIGRILSPPRIDDNRAIFTVAVGGDILRNVTPALDALAGTRIDNIFGRLAHLFEILSLVIPVISSCEEVETSPFRPVGPGVHSMNGSLLTGGRHRSLEHAMALLHDRIDEPWTLTELARQVSISTSHLVRLFNADEGVSPMAHLQRTRAERLAYLLRSTELSVSAAGRAVGWHDPGYAARRFRAHWHASPSEYRARFTVSPG